MNIEMFTPETMHEERIKVHTSVIITKGGTENEL